MAKNDRSAVLAFLREQAAKGGKIGGKRSLETMTAAERRAGDKKDGEAGATASKKKAKAKRAAG